jgi:sterol desaturase/sphingolipid hydroxylase (fatty acid hydroxylase superfamily)
VITHLAALVLGALGWTLAEYLLHRFDGHGMKGRTPFSREHLAHHTDPASFAPWSLKLALALVVLGLLSAVLVPLLGLTGLSATVGFTGGWLGYEWVHRRLHTHAAATAYGRWARRHHFQHHFNDASANHGVTSPVWDWLFGTLAPAAIVRVPRRHAPVWLVADGELLPRHADDYALRGRSRSRGQANGALRHKVEAGSTSAAG